jgi:hypothetical protein
VKPCFPEYVLNVSCGRCRGNLKDLGYFLSEMRPRRIRSRTSYLRPRTDGLGIACTVLTCAFTPMHDLNAGLYAGLPAIR